MKMYTGQKKLTTGNPIHLLLHSRQDLHCRRGIWNFIMVFQNAYRYLFIPRFLAEP